MSKEIPSVVCSLLNFASRSDISVRDQYILSYADYLHSDPALWRITVAYMCSCGLIGKERADQVLLRVPISFKTSPGNSGDVNAAAHSGEVPTALRAVVETCHEYGRESVRRMVCTVLVFLQHPFLVFSQTELCRSQREISFIIGNTDWLFRTQPRQKTGRGSVE
jgi:Nup85 Nucleoporin